MEEMILKFLALHCDTGFDTLKVKSRCLKKIWAFGTWCLEIVIFIVYSTEQKLLLSYLKSRIILIIKYSLIASEGLGI